MVKKGYLDTIGKYEKTFAQIFSYFLIYGDILTLIKNSEQTEEDKKFFNVKKLWFNDLNTPIAKVWLERYEFTKKMLEK